ncbi:hypothetical protein MUU77_12475 [Pseudoxanthomonas sp. F37]|jgi:hypothetical protein|uniref:hypothetical protein n=1 Tax=Pseudoxanthomonas TaxID=83618 RepID=UPI001FD37226|nr:MULTISPECIES: hypothetical protein [Pseudoxanthomonas]UOV06079.1 hypothetical protein MUU75_05190 [Pseudoxanthomonas mexicana]UOV07666.1 hypothetical protein MUU77_12475 [Pseudoxanthomonas sp. F37]
MSIQSKARREAKKRKATKERNQARANAPAIEPHAELRNPQGDLLAGIVRQAGVWVLGMDGRIAGSSDSAAEVLAMIKQAAALHEAQGNPVRLVYSDELRDTAVIEAAAQGLTLEQFEQQMAEQMKANKPEPAPDVN